MKDYYKILKIENYKKGSEAQLLWELERQEKEAKSLLNDVFVNEKLNEIDFFKSDNNDLTMKKKELEDLKKEILEFKKTLHEIGKSKYDSELKKSNTLRVKFTNNKEIIKKGIILVVAGSAISATVIGGFVFANYTIVDVPIPEGMSYEEVSSDYYINGTLLSYDENNAAVLVDRNYKEKTEKMVDEIKKDNIEEFDYVVKKGDNFISVCEKLNLDRNRIQNNVGNLYEGQVITFHINQFGTSFIYEKPLELEEKDEVHFDDSESLSFENEPSSYLKNPNSFENKIDELDDFFDYVVKEGDTLSSISDEYGVSIHTIMYLNNNVIKNENDIKIGDHIRLPKLLNNVKTR